MTCFVQKKRQKILRYCYQGAKTPNQKYIWQGYSQDQGRICQEGGTPPEKSAAPNLISLTYNFLKRRRDITIFHQRIIKVFLFYQKTCFMFINPTVFNKYSNREIFYGNPKQIYIAFLWTTQLLRAFAPSPQKSGGTSFFPRRKKFSMAKQFWSNRPEFAKWCWLQVTVLELFLRLSYFEKGFEWTSVGLHDLLVQYP